MFLRTTFGSKSDTSEWGCISETIADLTNKLLTCDVWDLKTLQSPHGNESPPRKSLHPDNPFAPAFATSFDTPQEDKGKTNVYIDDNVAIEPDLSGVPKNLKPLFLLQSVQ